MAAFLTGLSVCFLNAGSGKTAAITALSKMSGISISDIAAFGDDSNDVEMLKLCGIGVAVANAVPDGSFSNLLLLMQDFMQCQCNHTSFEPNRTMETSTSRTYSCAMLFAHFLKDPASLSL